MKIIPSVATTGIVKVKVKYFLCALCLAYKPVSVYALIDMILNKAGIQ